MPGLQTNSLDKIVKIYFAGVASKPFEYNGEIYTPKKVVVSPLIFRGMTCPMACGGCCFKFSLVWLPLEPKPYLTVEKDLVTVNGVERYVYIDRQAANTDHFCTHLQKKDGRCGIHGQHPFTCDFELIRFVHQADRVDIATRPFGRGWSYERVTGQKGALCDVLPPSEKHRDDAVRKLWRLKQWADYFELPTHLPRILDWVRSGPHDDPLVINPTTQSILELVK